MNTQYQKKDNVVDFSKNHLPENTSKALRVLIQFSEQLLDMSERETQALVQNDMATFAIIQSDKDTVSKKYADASKEFHERLEEFRGADIGLLDRLETLQHDLREKTVSNNKIVERMFHRSQEKVHDSLLSVQELATQKPVTINNASNGNKADKTGA